MITPAAGVFSYGGRWGNNERLNQPCWRMLALMSSAALRTFTEVRISRRSYHERLFRFRKSRCTFLFL